MPQADMEEPAQAHNTAATAIPQPIEDPSQVRAGNPSGPFAAQYPPFSQMRIISMPPEVVKKPRKTNYQKFTDEEDLFIVKKALEYREQFKNGPRREFWRRVQNELQELTGKEFSPFDRHLLNIMKKRRDRILKMPQQYLDWLDKWIEWHDTFTTTGNDIHISLPDNREYEDPNSARNQNSSKKRKRNTTGGNEFRRPPGRPPRLSAPASSAPGPSRGFINVEDYVPMNGAHATAPAQMTPAVHAPNQNPYQTPQPGPPAFAPQPYANVNGLLGNAANELDNNWLESVATDENNVDEDLNRIVEKLRSSLDKTSPRTAAHSSLLLAIIGLVRDNRRKIIDLEESVQKEQKKRKWNDDVVWSIVRNKCAELDLDYNTHRRLETDAETNQPPPPDTETYALARELKASTSELESQMSRVLTDLRHANDEISQLREVDKQHQQYIDRLKTVLKQQRNGATNGARDGASAEVAGLQDEIAGLRREREKDRETIQHQNGMLWRLDERLKALEAEEGSEGS